MLNNCVESTMIMGNLITFFINMPNIYDIRRLTNLDLENE